MKRKKVGLSLSGGGYRASAFHLGTLRKLNELGILSKVDVLSTISGGSITGAAYCLHQGSFEEFEMQMIQKLQKHSIIKFILCSWIFIRFALFTISVTGLSIWLFSKSLPWIGLGLLLAYIFFLIKYQFKLFPVSQAIEKAYNKFFFHNTVLDDLCTKPELAIGATNLQTGRPFTFSKRKMGDSTYAYMQPPIYFKGKMFPVAKAVMASSCVPFAFTPITISTEYYYHEQDSTRINPQIIDGGVYDNQGIQKLTHKGSTYECDIVITSDAGNKLPFEGSYNNTLVLLIRTVDVFMARIKNVQIAQNLYNTTVAMNKEIAYVSLGWDLEGCIPEFIRNLKNKKISQNLVNAHKIPQDWLLNIDENIDNLTVHLNQIVKYQSLEQKELTAEQTGIARSVGTNLTALTVTQINCLVRHAEKITELQLRLYCPTLFQ